MLQSMWTLLLLLMLPLLVLLSRRNPTSASVRFSSVDALKNCGVSWRQRLRPVLLVSRLLCLGLLIIALARPREGTSISRISTEGVAMEMRLNLEILAESGLVVEQLRAIGGGAKSPALVQLKADVLNRPITTLEVTEAGCLGVALLACAAHTGASPHEVVNAWVKPGPAVEPDSRRAARYNDRFAAYRKLYPAIRDAWNRLAVAR